MRQTLVLVLRNTLRHKFRTAFTVFGIGISLFAFCFIRIMLDAWHSGVEGSAKNRLVVRNSVSLVFYLPRSYLATISRMPGVSLVGYANWFGGKYKDKSYRFAQFAVSDEYLDVYPEYLLTEKEKKDFFSKKSGAVIGADIAADYGLKVGDIMNVEGTIFPGLWQFEITGLIKGRDPNTDTRLLLFHWDYLNDRNKVEIQRQPDYVGFYVVQLNAQTNPAEVSQRIDQEFSNSFAETLTETETAFQQSFVSMSSSIITALQLVSSVVVFIMLLVLSNTIVLSVRERAREYAVLRALGFEKRHLAILIFGEALLLSVLGFLLLVIVLTIFLMAPKRAIFGELMNFFPVIQLSAFTVAVTVTITLALACFSSVVPFLRLFRMRITEALRAFH